MNINEKILDLLYKNRTMNLLQLTIQLEREATLIESTLGTLIENGYVKLHTPPEQYAHITWYALSSEYYQIRYDTELASQQAWEEVYHNEN